MKALAIFTRPVDALEGASRLDPVSTAVGRAARALLPPGPVREALRGVPLGHPLHPLLVQVPLGAWLSAAALDVLPGTERAAELLVGVGVLTAVPAVAAGLAEYTGLDPRQQRVATVHAASNAVATGLHAASWAARRHGAPGRGRALAALGMAVAGLGGFLGGHLTYRQGAGVSRAG